ncbi:MAG: hypothetical protein J7501_17405 [Bdellovibrio sp.]|nr:hypothetical protein [Bdellovibrio sp.]
MTQKFLIASLASALLTLSACANFTKGTIKDSPHLNSQEIEIPPMNRLQPRDMALTIVDNRAPEYKQYSEEIKAEIYRAISLAAGRQNIQLKTNSSNTLVLTIQDYKTEEFQQGCVKLAGVLTVSKGKVNANSNSCMEFKNPFGFKVGSDIGQAYQMALTLIFKNLDAGLEQLP